jgi:autotransporter-associated beta strand protein
VGLKTKQIGIHQIMNIIKSNRICLKDATTPPLKSTLESISTRAASLLIAAAFAVILFRCGPAQAQQLEIWTSSSDNYTNGADWNPAITGTTTNWPTDDNGLTISGSEYEVLFTNGGTCYYVGPTTNDPYDPNWTNTIGQLYMGPLSGAASLVVNGTNTFNMEGGMLTMTDSGGDDWTVGGYSVNSVSNNCLFNMIGGTLNVTNSTGDAYVATGTNATGIANFEGGTANFNNLFLAGRGFATVNIDGGTVNVAPYNAYALTIGEGSSGTLSLNYSAYGILNLSSGALNVTNTAGNAVLNIGGRCNSATLNVTGGILNASEINWGTGVSGKVTNTFNLSGGTINVGGTGMGLGRGPYTDTNLLVISGGTFSTLPGYNCIETNAIGVTLATSPGPGVATFAPAAGTSFTINSVMKGAGSLEAAGPGQVILGGVSSYTGSTIVSGGELSLTAAGGFSGSPLVVISAGATFDLSAHPLTLPAGLTVSNSSSPAVINGSLASGLATAALTFAAGSPSFVISNGTLTLSNLTTFTVNNTGPVLAQGSYVIVANGGSGSVTGTVPAVTITGNGIAPGQVASLSINNDALYLVVSPPIPQITGFSVNGTNLTIAATDGPAGGTYTLLQSTNLLLPLNQWTPVLTNDFDNYGDLDLSTNIINPANPAMFYILQVP